MRGRPGGGSRHTNLDCFGWRRLRLIDAGSATYVAKIVERFRPQAIYGNATRRQVFMVVELETPAKMAELMYVLAWWLKTEPVFTPIMAPETYAEAIANAKKIFRPNLE